MLRIIAILLLSATSAFAEIPNHKDVVTAARATYDGLAPGRLRAYCVVNAAAYTLRAEGAGLFYKTGENGYADRSSDIIIYKPAGETFDVLVDAENKAQPSWARTKPTGFGPLANWRAPLDPATLTTCKTSTPPPPLPEPVPIPPDPLALRVAALEGANTALQARVTDLDRMLAQLSARVVLLEQPHLPQPCTPTEVNTSSTLWHSHHVTVCQ